MDPTAGNMTNDIKGVCRKFENITGMKVVVQERAGASIKHTAKAEPLRYKGCLREDCFPCRSGGNGRCENNGAGYRIECLTFQRAGKTTTYEGETSRNSYTRGLVHWNALCLKDKENALWKHCLVVHDGVEAEFRMDVIGIYRTPLVRQVNESVRIVMSKADCVMNSKTEWHQAPLIRILATNGLQEEQGAGRGSLPSLKGVGGDPRGQGGGVASPSLEGEGGAPKGQGGAASPSLVGEGGEASPKGDKGPDECQ